ncbi:Vacuolar ATPase assembly protein VMA22 [Colletotrichum chlorophyti]|uniref:Vacuolar ATPase assembly protein VMA22 n=1 Tax=Colletotrichum chlorophyti TaxID=708187 RepID=A0A1Q8RZZ4_9PEZI|nr:Vacuolar ATPase assembly protein VMA22 [Colletotrichum chlorophyti]
MDTGYIDGLLERYLLLLDEYTTLRERLSKIQAGMYQNIARANFSAERGVRYGPDYYDERMQASRILSVSVPEGKKVPCFEVVKAAEATEDAETPGPAAGDVNEAVAGDEGLTSDAGLKPEKKKEKKRNNDPIRWFGILAPLPLRQAQALSVQAVQNIIPRLVSVNVEMMDVEIEVRRAQKKRAKAEAAMKKTDEDLGVETERREVEATMVDAGST